MDSNESDDRLEVEQELWEIQARQRNSRKIEFVLRLYVVIGLVIGIAALIFFLFDRIHLDFNYKESLQLMIAGIALSLSLFSFMFLYYRKQRVESQINQSHFMRAASDFLSEWEQFENTGRMRLGKVGDDINLYSIRAIISELHKLNVISLSDAGYLEEVVRFRNRLVHSGQQIEVEQLESVTQGIARITAKLRPNQTEEKLDPPTSG